MGFGVEGLPLASSSLDPLPAASSEPGADPKAGPAGSLLPCPPLATDDRRVELLAKALGLDDGAKHAVTPGVKISFAMATQEGDTLEDISSAILTIEKGTFPATIPQRAWDASSPKINRTVFQ